MAFLLLPAGLGVSQVFSYTRANFFIEEFAIFMITDRMCPVYTLRKTDKLRKNKSFQAVYKEGKSFANRMLVLYMLPNESGTQRIGFAAGKRLGNAVIRNRVKRMMRETFRLYRAKLPPGYDYILVGRQPVVDVKMQEVVAAFLSLCGRAVRLSSNR